jgi:aminoglycoside 6'-N-acetyltransferase
VHLTGRRVTLRPGEPSDVSYLTAILSEPEVAGRWGHFDEAEVAKQFVGSDTAFVVTLNGEVIGAIQFGEEEDPMYRHAGIDIFLTASRHRQGLGSDALRTLARYLFEERGHHRLSIDPAADNEAAIRAYERVGFRTVGVMRGYERGPDGTWHDGLLMDMLADELTEAGSREGRGRG